MTITIKGTIEGYMSAATDAADELRQLDITIARIKRDLDKLMTQRMGARLRHDTYSELARVEKARQVCEEVTQREVDIATMRGVTLTVGQELTPSVKAILRGHHESDNHCEATE